MTILRRIALWVAGGIIALVLALVAVAELRWDRRFSAPPVRVAASQDAAVMARGRYLAYGPAHCVNCHLPPEDAQRFAAGEEPPLAGGMLFEIPPGKFFVPNITPDSATGIGRRTDGQLAQILRESVRADGRAALPFMAFQNISDEDLTALISFLRAQPAVSHVVPAHAINLMGKAVLALLIKPQGPDSPPPLRTPAADTPAYGAYLANAVAQCAGCHSMRSMMDGSYTGPRFAGGLVSPAEGEPNMVTVTPNLTPDSATGRIAAWTEAQFIARFRAGKVLPQSNMPWTEFARMTDADLRAIYRYLRSLPPVRHDPGPSLRPKD